MGHVKDAGGTMNVVKLIFNRLFFKPKLNISKIVKKDMHENIPSCITWIN